MAQDSKVNQIVYSMEVIRQQLEETEGQIQSVSMILQDIISSSEFLKNIGKVNETSLIPIGRGLYVEAELKDNKRVTVSIGSGAYKKTSVNEAIAILDDRKNDAAKALDDARRAEDELQKRYAQLEDYLNKVYKK